MNPPSTLIAELQPGSAGVSVRTGADLAPVEVVGFVRFAAVRRKTVSLLAECSETLGGVPKVVLADRMACLKADVVAVRAVATPDNIGFASHYRFRPDF